MRASKETQLKRPQRYWDGEEVQLGDVVVLGYTTTTPLEFTVYGLRMRDEDALIDVRRPRPRGGMTKRRDQYACNYRLVRREETAPVVTPEPSALGPHES